MLYSLIFSHLQHDAPIVEFTQWRHPKPCQPKMHCLFKIQFSFYRFIGSTNHTGCWKNKEKLVNHSFTAIIYERFECSTNILRSLLP